MLKDLFRIVVMLQARFRGRCFEGGEEASAELPWLNQQHPDVVFLYFARQALRETYECLSDTYWLLLDFVG